MVASTKARRGWQGGTSSTRRDALETDRAAGRDHDRHRLVGAVDRDLLGDVGEGRARERGGAHQDQRLGREVDVLLVLGGVAGDRLVAELRQLDADLGGRDPVGAVADHRPVAALGSEASGGLGDRGAVRQHRLHRGGQLAQRFEQPRRLGVESVVAPPPQPQGQVIAWRSATASRNPAATCE